jgi:uncharacterized membrane protein SpoIIM required for sporulation
MRKFRNVVDFWVTSTRQNKKKIQPVFSLGQEILEILSESWVYFLFSLFLIDGSGLYSKNLASNYLVNFSEPGYMSSSVQEPNSGFVIGISWNVTKATTILNKNAK